MNWHLDHQQGVVGPARSINHIGLRRLFVISISASKCLETERLRVVRAVRSCASIVRCTDWLVRSLDCVTLLSSVQCYGWIYSFPTAKQTYWAFLKFCWFVTFRYWKIVALWSLYEGWNPNGYEFVYIWWFLTIFEWRNVKLCVEWTAQIWLIYYGVLLSPLSKVLPFFLLFEYEWITNVSTNLDY